ncbi:MAG: hypothetical protein Q9221_008713 [Calogaya cf. arnoldii]
MDDKSSARAAEKKDKLEAQVKSADMVATLPSIPKTTRILILLKTDEMQQQAIEVALEAMEKFTIEKVACPKEI